MKIKREVAVVMEMTLKIVLVKKKLMRKESDMKLPKLEKH